MREATKITATWLGIVAGLAGLEHGIFEILQGNAQPEGLMIVSIGPPCDPLVAWNMCEPAMTILPSFLMTGILAVLISLAILIWSFGFLRGRLGGQVLMLLSSAMLLFGGGLFPPLIGLIAGAAATQISKSIPGEPGSILRWTAKLWPWPLVLLLIWLLGQFPVGYLFNDHLKNSMGFGLLLILTMLPLSIFVGYARDSVITKSSGDKC